MGRDGRVCAPPAQIVPPARPPSRAREPEPQGIRGQRLRINPALDGVADTFGISNKPGGPSGTRPTPLPPSDRPLARPLQNTSVSVMAGGRPDQKSPVVPASSSRAVNGMWCWVRVTIAAARPTTRRSSQSSGLVALGGLTVE